jgi:EmrB/QacA subfamily drug resistance transporter
MPRRGAPGCALGIGIMSSTENSAPPLSGDQLSRRRLVTTACMIAVFMPAIEATIVATAMPSIVSQLGGFEFFSWVFAAYLLTQAITTPIYGRLADLYGRKRVLFVGAGLFLLSSIACGFAWGMVPLIVFRILQGLGAGAIQSLPVTIIGDIYPPAQRARMQGWLSAVWGLAALAGPLLGALIVEHLSWSLVFWMNVPFGVAALIMLALYYDEERHERAHDVDYLGAILLMLGAGCLMVVLVQAESLGGQMIVSLLVVGAIALAALVMHERRVKEPILPFRLWRNRIIVIGNLGGLCIGALLMGISAFLPTYIQGVLGRSPTFAGFAVGAMSVAWSFAGVFAAGLMNRSSYRKTGALGAVALIVGSIILIMLNPRIDPLWTVAASFVMGIGMGYCNTTFLVSVQASVDASERGVATSSNMFLRVIGQTLGAALGGAMLNFGLARHAPDAGEAVNHLLEPGMRERMDPAALAHLIEAIANSLHAFYVVLALFAVALLALALLLPSKLSPTRPAA